MTAWPIGSTVVHKVLEAEVRASLTTALRTEDTALLKRYPWPAPDFSRADGTVVISVHALVVDTGARRILVDTCVGNSRPSVPMLRMLDTTWLDDLAALGYPAESIDTVVCTHLHFDHIGWNTRLVDGEWVPTFPRARTWSRARNGTTGPAKRAPKRVCATRCGPWSTQVSSTSSKPTTGCAKASASRRLRATPRARSPS
ncbi:MBL fold metallo-hydrolase [Streptomyces sp. NPDC058525]|uniref:MBL fold metallo-hydrolase n=1 Tax=Streptomyces sp. NPDC058525 TaxID=3346538 RepID=UPI00364954C3